MRMMTSLVKQARHLTTTGSWNTINLISDIMLAGRASLLALCAMRCTQTNSVFTFCCQTHFDPYEVKMSHLVQSGSNPLHDNKMTACTNIFYRIPSRRGTKIATLPGSNCNLGQFCDHIIAIEGIRQQDFLVGRKTKLFRPDNCSLRSISLPNNALVDIIIPLVAGKGGFGSLLRAIGAQIEKTTNRDACRDLSGRRLSNIKREEDLKKLIALQERLKEEKARRKKEKLEKLKKKVETSKTSASIQELVNMFDDHQYNRRRLEIGDIIEAAIDKGIINAKKRKADVDDLVELDATKKHKTDPIDEQSRDASPELREPNDSHDGSRVDKSTAGSEDRAPVKSEPVNARPQINATGPWLGASSDEDDNT